MESIFGRVSSAGDDVFFLLGAEVSGEQVASGVGLAEGGGREELLVFRVQFSEKKKIRRRWRTSAGSGCAAR